MKVVAEPQCRRKGASPTGDVPPTQALQIACSFVLPACLDRFVWQSDGQST